MSLYKEVKFYKRVQSSRYVVLQEDPVNMNIELICWIKKSRRQEEVLSGDMSSNSTYKDVSVYELGLSDNSKWIVPTSEIDKLSLEVHTENGPIIL